MTPLEWLSESWNGPLPFPYEDMRTTILNVTEPTRLQVLAALVGINGGFDVRGWGITSGDGLYGRRGLEQDEALCLLQLRSFLDGMVAGRGSAAELTEVFEAMRVEHQRMHALRSLLEAPRAD